MPQQTRLANTHKIPVLHPISQIKPGETGNVAPSAMKVDQDGNTWLDANAHVSREYTEQFCMKVWYYGGIHQVHLP